MTKLTKTDEILQDQLLVMEWEYLSDEKLKLIEDSRTIDQELARKLESEKS